LSTKTRGNYGRQPSQIMRANCYKQAISLLILIPARPVGYFKHTSWFL